MTGPVNVKKISTLNVKSGRPGKCEKNSTLNVKKVRSVASPVRWSVWTIWSAWSVFSAFSGFGVSIFQKLKILGSVMILKENVKGGGEVWVRNSKIYRKYIDVQRKF